MMTDDVQPFEMMKLRMLNGAHTFLAMLGSLSGLETVSACMEDDVFRKAARQIMVDEQRPTLPAIEGVDLDDYADALIHRFTNPKLKHRTSQIAWDTSQKLPQRLLHGIADNIENNRPWPLLALAVAGWIRFVRVTANEGGKLTDPLSDALLAEAKDYDGDQLVDRILANESIFDEELRREPAFRSAITGAYRNIVEMGPRQAVEIHSQGIKKGGNLPAFSVLKFIGRKASGIHLTHRPQPGHQRAIGQQHDETEDQFDREIAQRPGDPARHFHDREDTEERCNAEREFIIGADEDEDGGKADREEQHRIEDRAEQRADQRRLPPALPA
nr:hypothetical protein [Marinicella sp. W31]MDC2875673.1 hypothetical protein [Marinicella sp. W31]